MKILNKRNYLLASKSPRRQALLSELGLQFKVCTKDTPEEYPSHLKGKEIALFLAEHKATAFAADEIPEQTVLITADTVVWHQNESLAKPADPNTAREMLTKLSGCAHEVITGVCLRSRNNMRTFAVTTKVFFKALTPDEIDYYVEHYQPFDKAGGYGIQEWIGYIGIEKIEGSYFNVVGLPVQRVYQELLQFQLD